MKHLVTGGAGFLGHLIVDRLLDAGEDVRCLDVKFDPNLPDNVEYVRADVRNRSDVRSACQDVDIVHHNAALVPLTKSGDEFREVNVTGSRIVAEEALEAGVQSFVHMSSSAIFGAPDEGPVDRTTEPQPIERYGQSKLDGELRVRDTFENTDSQLIVIRPRTIMGKGRLGIFQILFEWIRDDCDVYTIGDGSNKFQFVHASDLMDAYMLLMDQEESGHYNIGTNSFGTLRESIADLIDYANSESQIRSLPIRLTIFTLRALDWLGLSPLAPWHYRTYHKPFYFDVSDLEALGWNPEYSNRKMLRESYDWYLNRDQIPVDADSRGTHRQAVKQGILWLLKKIS